MNQEILALSLTAASIGFFHTILGPDHYLPFVAMSQARGWSRLRTISLTIICGIGHVASSVVLGLLGAALGMAVSRLEAIESIRGDLAAWVLIAFGLVYFVWGIRRAIKKKCILIRIRILMIKKLISPPGFYLRFLCWVPVNR